MPFATSSRSGYFRTGKVWSGLVQGFSTPPLLLLIMLMTNNPDHHGEPCQLASENLLGWITTAMIFLASIGLVATWFI
jgi:hypothetical protein